jgi:hypothetical protein
MPDDRLLNLINAEIESRLAGVEGLEQLSDVELLRLLADECKELGIEIDLSLAPQFREIVRSR